MSRGWRLAIVLYGLILVVVLLLVPEHTSIRVDDRTLPGPDGLPHELPPAAELGWEQVGPPCELLTIAGERELLSPDDLEGALRLGVESLGRRQLLPVNQC